MSDQRPDGPGAVMRLSYPQLYASPDGETHFQDVPVSMTPVGAHMTSAMSGSSVLVGRDAELEQADRLIEGAIGRCGSLLLIRGEAGIGKTSLTTTIAQRAQRRGAVIAVGRCYETGSMPAFAPWQELLGELRLAGVGVGELPAPFGLGSATRTAYELMQAVARALIDASQQQPLVLCLEDVLQRMMALTTRPSALSWSSLPSR